MTTARSHHEADQLFGTDGRGTYWQEVDLWATPLDQEILATNAHRRGEHERSDNGDSNRDEDCPMCQVTRPVHTHRALRVSVL